MKKNFNFHSIAVILFVLTMGQGCERDTPRVTSPSPKSEELFAGTLQNVAGDKLVGTITINQKSITTSGDGAFSVLVPHAEKYVVNAHASGYLMHSAVYWGRGRENLKLQLRPTEQFSFDAKMPLSQEDSRGTLIELPADALLDVNGQPPSGPVNIDMHTYNLLTERMVGDMSALDSSNRPVALRSIGAVSVEFSDAQGNAYNLAPGKKATLSLRMPPGDNYEGHVPLWWYDTQQGIWREEGTATVKDGIITGEVGHFSVWNADFKFENSSCVNIKVDRDWFFNHLPEGGSSVDVLARVANNSRTFLMNLTFDNPDANQLIYHLENNVVLDLELPDGTHRPVDTLGGWARASSGPDGGPDVRPHPPGPDYNGCVQVVLGSSAAPIISLPTIEGIALRQHRASPKITDEIQIELAVEGEPPSYGVAGANGNYSVFSPMLGRATVTASKRGYLSARREGVSLSGAGVVTLPEVQLLAGDVYQSDRKNCVTRVDTSLIIKSIGQAVTGVDNILDINGDKVVDFDDLALAAENGGKCGPTVW